MHELIVIGASAGGMKALAEIITELPQDYPLAVAIVLHRPHDEFDYVTEYLQRISKITVKGAELQESIKAPCVYVAPSGYHLQVERDKKFTLSIDPPVNYSIPSIDVLFESAAIAYREKLIGVILTGANSDGARGMTVIKKLGGLTLAQDPETAEVPTMPQASIEATDIDHIASLQGISCLLKKLCREESSNA